MVWLSHAIRNNTARVLIILLLIYPVAAMGLVHCVVDSAEVLYVVFEGGATLGAFLFGLFLPAMLGNTVGGVVRVAILNYAQTSRQRFPDRDVGELDLSGASGCSNVMPGSRWARAKRTLVRRMTPRRTKGSADATELPQVPLLQEPERHRSGAHSFSSAAHKHEGSTSEAARQRRDDQYVQARRFSDEEGINIIQVSWTLGAGRQGNPKEIHGPYSRSVACDNDGRAEGL